jgi:hypothetical protein
MPVPYGAPGLRVREAVSLADTLLAAALAYAAAGWPVFPCEAGGKRPVPIHGFKDAVSDADRIRAWWHGRPYNIGVSTGYPCPDVLDVDVRPDGSGWAAFGRLKRAGLLAGAFRLVRTPSGGGHLYFAGTQQGCGSLRGEHLDMKGTGGYVLVPPSQVGGRRYEVVDERPPTGAVFDWEAAKRLLCPPRPVPPCGTFRRGPGSAKHLVTWLQGEVQGNRNGGLFWAACTALEAGDEAVIDDLAAVALGAGLADDEVRKTIGSAYRKVAAGQ